MFIPPRIYDSRSSCLAFPDTDACGTQIGLPVTCGALPSCCTRHQRRSRSCPTFRYLTELQHHNWEQVQRDDPLQDAALRHCLVALKMRQQQLANDFRLCPPLRTLWPLLNGSLQLHLDLRPNVIPNAKQSSTLSDHRAHVAPAARQPTASTVPAADEPSASVNYTAAVAPTARQLSALSDPTAPEAPAAMQSSGSCGIR